MLPNPAILSGFFKVGINNVICTIMEGTLHECCNPFLLYANLFV